jgi:hypothetical protein
MKYRRQLSTLLVVFAFGCGSDAQVVPAAGNDDASNVGSSSGVDATTGGSTCFAGASAWQPVTSR